VDRAHFARVAGDSEVRISNLESGHYQLQLAKGLVTYRVLREANGQPEISTPLVAVRPVREASVRVEVAPDASTRITVRRGDADPVEVFATTETSGPIALSWPADASRHSLLSAGTFRATLGTGRILTRSTR